jgi:hypothetical protein
MRTSRPPEDHERRAAEMRLTKVERGRTTRRAVAKALLLKDEVAAQIAQLDDDRIRSLRPSHQIPHNWKCVHIAERQDFYKVVACTDKTFVSVYDGKTEYVLGGVKGERGKEALGSGSVSCEKMTTRNLCQSCLPRNQSQQKSIQNT